MSNLETIYDNNLQTQIENVVTITKSIYQNSMELNQLIDDIDFTKILKCYHMEMEAKFRKEYEPIQASLVKTLQWHEQMAQRHIVQKFKQTEDDLKKTQATLNKQRSTMAKSLEQSQEVLNKALIKRNDIIVRIIKSVKTVENLKENVSERIL